MSGTERHPLEIAVNGPLASEDSLDIVEMYAEELLQNETERKLSRSHTYTSDFSATGANLTLTNTCYPDNPNLLPVSQVVLTDFGTTDASLTMEFDADKLIRYTIDEGNSDRVLTDLFFMADALLDDCVALDEPGAAITIHLRNFIEQLYGSKTAADAAMAEDGTKINDLVLQALHDQEADALHTKIYERKLNKNVQIRVIGALAIAGCSLSNIDDFEFEDVDDLEIILEDASQDRHWYYNRDLSEEPVLEVTQLSDDGEYQVKLTSEQEDEFDDAIETSNLDVPTEHDITILIRHLSMARTTGRQPVKRPLCN